MRHLITLADVSREDIERIFSISSELKTKLAAGIREPLLAALGKLLEPAGILLRGDSRSRRPIVRSLQHRPCALAIARLASPAAS